MTKIVETVELAAIFDVSVRTIGRWIAEGMPVHERGGGAGKYSLFDTAKCIGWRVAQSSGSDLDLNAERARLAKEQADKTALDNALRREELVSVHDVKGLWAKLASETRSRVLGVPVKVAPLVMGLESMPEAKEIIETALYDALNSLASDRSGLPDSDQTAAEDDAERMGGHAPEAKQRG